LSLGILQREFSTDFMLHLLWCARAAASKLHPIVSLQVVTMQSMHKEQELANLESTAELSKAARPPLRIVVQNPELTKGWRNEPALAAGYAHWVGLGFLILMFAASVAYVCFGGVFEG
jgi:hypothetical protein